MSIHFFKKNGVHILCLFIYCFTTFVIAQKQEISAQIDTITFQKSLAAKSFNAVIDTFYQNKHSDSTKAATTIAYIKRHFLNSKDENEIIESYLTIAAWEHKNYNLNAAMFNVELAIKMAVKLDRKELLYEGYTKKGIYLFETGKNEQALNNFLIALEISKETNNIKRQISASNNIILIKIQANDNLGAIDLYHENLERIESSNDKSLQQKKLQIYLGLSKAYINVDNYDKATLYCNKGLEISSEMNALNFQAYFHTFLGEIASNQGSYSKAYELFDKAYELIEKAGGDKTLDVFLKLYVGKTYFLEKKYSDAIKELRKGEELIELNAVDFLSIQELYVYLAKSYLALKNVKESTKYFKKVYDIDAKNDKTRAIINSRITQDTLAKLKEEIDLLEQKSKRTKYLYFAGITALLFVIVGLILFNKKQQQKNKMRFNNLMLQLEEKRRQVKLQEKTHSEKKKSTPKETVSKEEIDKQPAEIDPKVAVILKKLVEFEKKELFLSKESTLVEVAKKIHTNTTYLSKVINTHKEKSFTAYITDLRVEHAIERLSNDRKFRSFTIGAIAQEIGFKRSESFSKAFKVKTGLYPSYFIKELEKQMVAK